MRRHRGSQIDQNGYGENEDVETIKVKKEHQLIFSINDADVQKLARMAIKIENHYGCPMDIEWGKDGKDGKLYILQARPETVESRTNKNVLTRYQIQQHGGKVLITGRSIGQRIGAGKVRVVRDIKLIDKVQKGDVLVTDMTDPDWEPVMKRASAIITNRGGRTCHAAIIARELGVPAVVGCNNATEIIPNGSGVTVSCAEGDTGKIYDRILDFKINKIELDDLPNIPFKVMLNVGSPDSAFDFQRLPNHGIGLARLEFIINNTIGIHPKALFPMSKWKKASKISLMNELLDTKAQLIFMSKN